MEYEVIITKRTIKRVLANMNCKIWHVPKNHNVFRCHICGKKIRVGTMAVHIGNWRYIHKSCYPRFRIDVTEEPTEEELENFFS